MAITPHHQVPGVEFSNIIFLYISWSQNINVAINFRATPKSKNRELAYTIATYLIEHGSILWNNT
jgi:hypothetical protein